MIYYTDGSCNNNGYFPNKGGYGVVAFDNDEKYVVKAWSQLSENTTNNREEMKAILFIMDNFGVKVSGSENEEEIPYVFTDSAYAYNTFTNWMFKWAKDNWTKSNGDIPENLDIIQFFYKLYQEGHRINLIKTKGHCGILGNELADWLATGKITSEEVLNKYGNK